MATRIRTLQPADIPALYALYDEIRDTPAELDLQVTTSQFARHLNRGRLYTPDDWYDPAAEIALVAEEAGEIRAYANGRLLRHGDFLLADDTALVQWVLGRRRHRGAISAVIEAVTTHLQKFKPAAIHAFNGMTTPIFAGNLGGGLPAAWPWIGQCLADLGFAAQKPNWLMWCDLSARDPTLPDVPDGLELKQGQTFVEDYCAGLESEYNAGHYLLDGERFVGWCGDFYAGAFVEGAGRDYLFTHWFTVEDAWRTRGLGRWLLRHSLAEARRNAARGALLLTDVDNFRALNLYLSEGYRPLTLSHSFVHEPKEEAGEV